MMAELGGVDCPRRDWFGLLLPKEPGLPEMVDVRGGSGGNKRCVSDLMMSKKGACCVETVCLVVRLDGLMRVGSMVKGAAGFGSGLDRMGWCMVL